MPKITKDKEEGGGRERKRGNRDQEEKHIYYIKLLVFLFTISCLFKFPTKYLYIKHTSTNPLFSINSYNISFK